jgi:hypothetical protein
MLLCVGDHPGRQRCGQDLADEPVRQQEVLQSVQGHHRGRLSNQGGSYQDFDLAKV